MRRPPGELLRAVKARGQAGTLSRRELRQVLHYRGYFNAVDKLNDVVLDNDPDSIVRVYLTARGSRAYSARG
jgi:hypothetical protein